MIREKAQLLTVHETKFKQMAELLDLPASEGRHSLLEGLRANLRPMMEQSAQDIANRVSKEVSQEQGKKFVTLEDFKVHQERQELVLEELGEQSVAQGLRVDEALN